MNDRPSSASVAGTCVFVVGMHRSGTSAVTGVLARLGMAGPSQHDLVPATASNQRGHFESKILTLIDNQLLHILGGTWSAPPSLEPGWEQASAVAGLQQRAGNAFHSTFPTRPVAWKDPRNCIVLPFWRSVVTPPMAAVLVYRDGLDVAHSLRIRNHLNLTHGLALWERYVRSACANLSGVPTFLAEYGQLLGDPASFCGDLVRFLTDIGVDIDTARTAMAADSLDARLRHAQSGSEMPAGVIDSQRELLGALRRLHGAHHPWLSPDLGVEPEWVEDVLSLRRDYEVLQRQVRSSRAMCLVEGWWSLRGARRPPPTVDDEDP